MKILLIFIRCLIIFLRRGYSFAHRFIIVECVDGVVPILLLGGLLVLLVLGGVVGSRLLAVDLPRRVLLQSGPLLFLNESTRTAMLKMWRSSSSQVMSWIPPKM